MRILIASFIAFVLVLTTGCGGNRSNGASSPKAIANIVFNGLKEDAFGKVADLVLPDESDKEAFVRQTSEDENRDESKYDRKKWLKELELAFNTVRSKYNDEAWKSAKIISYIGIEGFRRYEHVSIVIQLEGRRHELYVGEVAMEDGKWYLVTAPEWD